MNDITKQDIEDLTKAMVGGFEAIHDRFEGINTRFDDVEQELSELKTTSLAHSDPLDHIAKKVDDLWTENAAQTIHNRRMEVRIRRVEEHLGLFEEHEEMIAA